MLSLSRCFHILWNPKVHHRVHKRSPLDHILSQTLQSTLSHPVSLRIIIILTSRLSIGHLRSLSFRFSYQNFACTSLLSHACCIPRPPHSPYLTILKTSGKEYKLINSSLCIFLHYPLTSSLLGPKILNMFYSSIFNYINRMMYRALKV
jgi:hypothetical protein